MAISRNPYAEYQNSKVLTASPAELTLMLYDGMVKFINIAITGVEEKDYEKVNLNAQKAQRIIDHLNETLNDRYEVAKDFHNIYKCIMDALVQGNLHKDIAEFEQALDYAKSIRDTWKQVMQASVRGKRIEK